MFGNNEAIIEINESIIENNESMNQSLKTMNQLKSIEINEERST